MRFCVSHFRCECVCVTHEFVVFSNFIADNTATNFVFSQWYGHRRHNPVIDQHWLRLFMQCAFIPITNTNNLQLVQDKKCTTTHPAANQTDNYKMKLQSTSTRMNLHDRQTDKDKKCAEKTKATTMQQK